jgi:hypothetical protein
MAAVSSQAWRRLKGDLPSLPDPSEEADTVWQQLRAEFMWYHRAAVRTRVAFLTLKIISLVVAAAVPVVAAVSAPAGLTASLAAIVVVLESIQQLLQLQANWITYRSTAEALRQHAFMYAGHVSPYKDSATRRDLLAEFIRAAVADESTRWSSSMRQSVQPPPTANA